MKKSFPTFVFIFLAALVLGVLNSCSSLRVNPPRVSLKDVRLTSLTLFETSLEAIVRLENRDSKELVVRGANYDLELNGLDIGSGLAKSSVTLEPFGTKEQTVVFHFSNLRLLTQIQRMLDSPELTYAIDGELSTGRFSSIPIHDSGTLSQNGLRQGS